MIAIDFELTKIQSCVNLNQSQKNIIDHINRVLVEFNN